MLRLPKRHEIRSPAVLLMGKEAEFNQAGLFSTHECAPCLSLASLLTGKEVHFDTCWPVQQARALMAHPAAVAGNSLWQGLFTAQVCACVEQMRCQ